MGLSSQTTKTKSKETATTTPNLAPYTQGPIEDYYGKLGGLMDLPASSVVTPQNSLQQQASGTASSLLNGLLSAHGNITPTQAKTVRAGLPAAISATNVANVDAPQFAGATVANLPTAAQATDTSGLAGKDVAQFGGASAYGGINQYLDPYLKDNVAASLASFDDDAGRQTAAYQAMGAKNKMFGGSRFGIGEAQLGSDLARNRALTDAELRSDAYKTALGASSADADRANSAGIASMQAQNSRDEMLGSLAAQLGIFNAGAKNEFGMAGFDALNDTSRFNAGEANDLYSMLYGEQNANARQNASAANDINSLVYGTTADTNRFNAGQANDTSRFNADTLNDMSRFNSDAALQRVQAGLSGAGLLSDLGGQQFSIDRQNQLAPYTQQQILAELLNGGGLLGATTGQTVNGSSEGTTKQGMNLLQSLIAAGSKVGSAFAGGG